MAKVEMGLEELRDLLASMGAYGREMQKTQIRKSQKIVAKPKKPRKKTAWDRHLKSFKFRKQKRNESNSAYFGARTKAASRAYKRRKK